MRQQTTKVEKNISNKQFIYKGQIMIANNGK